MALCQRSGKAPNQKTSREGWPFAPRPQVGSFAYHHPKADSVLLLDWLYDLFHYWHKLNPPPAYSECRGELWPRPCWCYRAVSRQASIARHYRSRLVQALPESQLCVRRAGVAWPFATRAWPREKPGATWNHGEISDGSSGVQLQRRDRRNRNVMMTGSWESENGGPITAGTALTEPHDLVRLPMCLGNRAFFCFFSRTNLCFLKWCFSRNTPWWERLFVAL